jgi:hypothetical protein
VLGGNCHGKWANSLCLKFEEQSGSIGTVKQFLKVTVLLCFCASSALAQESCAETSHGKCFSFHGRFAIYKCKLLDDCSIQTVSDYFLFGDFVVCPLEKDTPGAKRSVCIKSARNLRRVRRKFPN